MKTARWIVTLALSAALRAQSGISALDALTPKGLEPGSPAGSYALSGIDTVNLYNGSVNVSVPLVQIGGRGEAGYTMRAQPRVGWEIYGESVTSGGSCSTSNPCSFWNPSKAGAIDLGYRPARIELTGIELNPYTLNEANGDPCTNPVVYTSTLTRLTVSLSDGTRMEFRDAVLGGKMGGPSSIQTCSPLELRESNVNRGKIWVSVDGSGTKFVADNDIRDYNWPAAPAPSFGTGTLYFPDGRKYRFGMHASPYGSFQVVDVDWIEDRNGNRTTFLYPSQQNPTIANSNPAAPACTLVAGVSENYCVVDSMGRTTRVTLGSPWNCGADCSGIFDEITFKGSGGIVDRTVKVFRRGYWDDRLPTLANTQQPSPADLFGGHACASTGCPHTNFGSCFCAGWETQISKIEIPDGTNYQFNYDIYGDVAKITLPTKGVIEFDWESGPGIAPAPLGTCTHGTCPVVHAVLNNPEDLLVAVYRRVKERRERANGSTLTRTTTYSVTESANNSGLEDPIGVCTAAPDYTAHPSYPYATQGHCSIVEVDESDPALGTLVKRKHYFYGAASKGMFPVPGWNTYWAEGKEFRTDVIEPSTSTTLRKQIQSWTQNSGLAPALNWWTTGLGPKPAVDPRVYQSDLTIDTNKVSRQGFADDAYSNRTDVWDYSYGTGSPGPVYRQTHTDFITSGAKNTIPASLTGASPAPTFTYLVRLPSSQAVRDSAGSDKAKTQYTYDQGPLSPSGSLINHNSFIGSERGNAIKVENWRSDSGTWLETLTTFDIAGNPLTVTTPGSPANRKTTYTYNSCAGTVYENGRALPDTVENPLNQTTNYTWDCALGKPTDLQTPSGFITHADYNDLLDRPKSVIRAMDVANSQNKLVFNYTDLVGGGVQIESKQDKDTFQDGGLRSETITDGLGRAIETRTYTGASSYISTTKALDALGRTRRAYNPGSTTEYTQFAYDALDRVTETLYVDGSGGPNYSKDTATYSGNVVTFADAAGKSTQQTLDAFGRIVSVIEDPGTSPKLNYLTSYCYDVLDNLLLVNQGGTANCGVTPPTGTGGQTRTFTYNSLKQLLTASNPEVGGPVTYTYHPSGDLHTKAAPGVTTTYNYDMLGRPTGKTYSDDTPDVSYLYDTIQTGCLTSVTAVKGATNYISSFPAYDPYCAPTQSKQQITGVPDYSFEYKYNLAGALTSEKYPSGRWVSTVYDGAGRPAVVCGIASLPAGQSLNCLNPGGTVTNYVGSNCGTLTDPACRVQYAPHGAVQSLKYGNGVQETASYNGRLQMSSMVASKSGTTLLNLGFSYCPSEAPTCNVNNGNLLSQRIAYPASTAEPSALNVLQNYSYTEGVNRLTGFEEASKTQTYNYDRFGNRWVSPSNAAFPASSVTSQAQILAANNRLNITTDCNLNGVTSGYDDRGNLKYHCPFTLTYDGEDREISAVSANNGSTTYEYDGEGRRVRKVVTNPTSTTTVFVYDAFGQLAAEYGGPVTPTGTEYLTGDHLGSTRLVTDGSASAVVRRYDYLPFGQGLGGVNGRSSKYPGYNAGAFPATPCDGGTVKFTSKERDCETGLDYFGARYMSSAQGRFTSVDPVFATASLYDGQSWNGYTYTLNNPLQYVDRDGNLPIPIIAGAIGAVVGGAAGAIGEAYSQYRDTGHIVSGAKIWTAAGGGAIAGGLSGLTLGIGSAAGAGSGLAFTALVSGSTNAIGGMAQRGANVALGLDAPVSQSTEFANVASDALGGALGGAIGGKLADRWLPINNVRKQIELLRFASRRSTRAAQQAAALTEAKSQVAKNSFLSSVVDDGAISPGISKLWGLLFPERPPQRPPAKKKEPTEECTFTMLDGQPIGGQCRPIGH